MSNFKKSFVLGLVGGCALACVLLYGFNLGVFSKTGNSKGNKGTVVNKDVSYDVAVKNKELMENATPCTFILEKFPEGIFYKIDNEETGTLYKEYNEKVLAFTTGVTYAVREMKEGSYDAKYWYSINNDGTVDMNIGIDITLDMLGGGFSDYDETRFREDGAENLAGNKVLVSKRVILVREDVKGTGISI